MDNKSIFLVFDDVIKTPSLAILNALLEPDMRKNFSEVIDYTKFEYMNQDNMLRLCIQRSEKNILRYLGTSDSFDYDNMEKIIIENIKDRFNDYPSLKMVEVIALAISTPQVGSVYVYSKNYDEQIHTQLGLLFNANSAKIKYVYGELSDILNDKNINLYILPDLDYLDEVYKLKKLHGKEVLVANYGYNYMLDENNNLVFKLDVEKYIDDLCLFTIRAFSPFELSDRHFSQIENNIDKNNNLSLG